MLLFNNMILRKKIEILLLLLIVGVFGIVFYFILTEIQKKEVKPEDLKISLTEEEKILKKLSTEEKVGQLFMIGFDGITLTSEIKNLFKVVRPGGVILLSRNIHDANQLKKLIRDLQNLSVEESGLPLFVAVDQEGGLVRRIQWIEDEISQAGIKNNDQAYQTGLKRGGELKSLGINLNLAPVLDITQKSDFLYNRSFQRSPEITGDLSKGLILGQKDSGIFTTIKHFPGYGGISFNPETVKIPIVSQIPEVSQFQKAMEAQPELIMTASVIYSEIDEKLPFTLSLNGIRFLKEKIKGDFIIISDDLSSKVLRENFSSENQIILGKKAGVDILLVVGWNQLHQDQLDAFNTLLKAVQEKEVDEKQINDSVFKIIKLKQKISQTPIDKTEQVKTEPPKIDDLKIEETNKLPEINISNGQLNITDKLLYWGYEIPPSPRSIDTIIIHSAYDALGNDPYSVDGLIDEFKIYDVAAHYLIDRNGIIYRLVEEKNIAYHAGGGKMPNGRTDINNFSIGVELIYTKSEKPNKVQYTSLFRLIKSLKSKYEIRHILGHNQIAPERKTDPWNFDWQKFNEGIKDF